MATINQSPAGQASITLSGVSFNDITATATPVRAASRFTVQGGSFAVNIGGATSAEPLPQPPIRSFPKLRVR